MSDWHAVQCACGRRIEGTNDFARLKANGHDPNRCSAEIAYQGRIRGRQEIVGVCIDHLAERRSLSGAELAEIRTVLAGKAATLPLT